MGNTIRTASESHILICFGMQMAVIEAARNLAGIPEANSTEFGDCKEPGRPAYRMDARQHCGTT